MTQLQALNFHLKRDFEPTLRIYITHDSQVEGNIFENIYTANGNIPLGNKGENMRYSFGYIVALLIKTPFSERYRQYNRF